MTQMNLSAARASRSTSALPIQVRHPAAVSADKLRWVPPTHRCLLLCVSPTPTKPLPGLQGGATISSHNIIPSSPPPFACALALRPALALTPSSRDPERRREMLFYDTASLIGELQHDVAPSQYLCVLLSH